MSRTRPIGSLIWSQARSMRLVRLFQPDSGARTVRRKPYNIFIFSDKGDAALNSSSSHPGQLLRVPGRLYPRENRTHFLGRLSARVAKGCRGVS
jgi:hypothetical protein